MSDRDARPPDQKRLDELERVRTAAQHRRSRSAEDAHDGDDADVYELKHHHGKPEGTAGP